MSIYIVPVSKEEAERLEESNSWHLNHALRRERAIEKITGPKSPVWSGPSRIALLKLINTTYYSNSASIDHTGFVVMPKKSTPWQAFKAFLKSFI